MFLDDGYKKVYITVCTIKKKKGIRVAKNHKSLTTNCEMIIFLLNPINLALFQKYIKQLHFKAKCKK